MCGSRTNWKKKSIKPLYQLDSSIIVKKKYVQKLIKFLSKSKTEKKSKHIIK